MDKPVAFLVVRLSAGHMVFSSRDNEVMRLVVARETHVMVRI